MDIGSNIKKIRELKNFNQNYVATALGISQKSYSNIEKSKNKITIELIQKIAEVLNVSFSKIVELNTEVILNNYNQKGGIGQINTSSNQNAMADNTMELFEKILLEKDKQIELLKKTIDLLESQLIISKVK
ncbi:MAG: helix-turn-helix domain-containing protein [Bacteroidota bacterium]|jgi:transcriptional regulator with XRE-family HTH domain